MYRQRFPDDPGQHVGEDTYRQTTYRTNPSFCDRVRSSLVAIIVGIGLLTAASGLIFWNEGRAVQTAKSLQEGLDMVHEVQNTEVAFAENNGKLIYLSGPLRTSNILVDDDYGISINAVKLKRTVEMYQWVEEEHTREIKEADRTRKETTYSYSKYWRAGVVRSSQFANPTGHHNPTDISIKSLTLTAGRSSVGNFHLSEGMVGKIRNFRQLHLKEPPKSDTSTKLLGGRIHHGKDPLQPEVGDLRVMFEFAGLAETETNELGDPDIVSVIGKQDENRVQEYQTEAGDKLEILYMGSFTAKQIFGQEMAQNSFLTWAMRFGGWLMMFVGFGCVTRIIVTLVDWIPFVRDLVNLGVTTFNAILSISLSLTIIAFGWIWYRPLLGCFVLGLAALPFILSRRRAVASRNIQTYYRPTTTHRDW